MEGIGGGSSREILVLYATETGTSKEYAERLERELQRQYIRVRIHQTDEYWQNEIFGERLVVFICSTTGEGEVPRCMKVYKISLRVKVGNVLILKQLLYNKILQKKKFWNFLLLKSHKADSLEKLKFSVFGLGDSIYPKFNYTSKKLYNRLLQLGATPLTPRGCSDESSALGHETAFLPWKNALNEALSKLMPLPSGIVPISKNEVPRSRYKVKEVKNQIPITPDNLFRRLGFYPGKLKANVDLTPEKYNRQVKRLKFETEKQVNYYPGDVCMVYPQNAKEDVMKVARIFNIDSLDLILEITENTGCVPKFLKSPISFENLITYALDLSSKPSYCCVEILSHFAIREEHREKLRDLLLPENDVRNEYYEYFQTSKRNILEVLWDFPSNIPIDYLFDVFNIIRPRHFSISNKMRDDRTFDLTVLNVEYRTYLQKPRTGFCSRYLCNLKLDDTVFCQLTSGNLDIKDDEYNHVILVATGTGISAILSLIHHRVKNLEVISTDSIKTCVVYGNRYKNKDFLYGDELTKYELENKIKLFTAFSRDSDKKIYVQHVIETHGEFFCDWILNKDSIIIISGNSKTIPSAIQNVILRILQKYGKLSEQDSQRYLLIMKKTKRLQMECWS